jgi:hypothetical protein
MFNLYLTRDSKSNKESIFEIWETFTNFHMEAELVPFTFFGDNNQIECKKLGISGSLLYKVSFCLPDSPYLKEGVITLGNRYDGGTKPRIEIFDRFIL